MNTSKGTEVGSTRRPCALAGMAMDFALAITIIIPRPFVHTMSNRGMVRMAAAIARPLIGRGPRAADRDVRRDQPHTGARIGVVTDPPARRARVARDEADAGRPIVGIRALPVALMGAPAWWIGGVAMGGAFFPRVLVELISLKGGTRHHPGRRGRMQLGLEALPEGMELCARHPQFTREARRRLTFGDPTPQQYQGGRSLPRVCEHRPREQRVVAVAGPTTVGWKVALRTEHASSRTLAAGAVQAVWVEVPLQPYQRGAIVASLGNGKLDHRPMLPQCAQ
jgi:hypothetical protein